MDISLHFNISIFLLLLFLLPLLLLKLLRHFYRYGKLRLPPSPPKLPFIGNLHQLGTLPHRSLQLLSNKYGPLMLLQLGRSPTIVVSSDQVVREMIKNHDVLFSDRPNPTAPDILLYGCRDIVFSPYGEYWRQARKLCVLELLSHQKLQSFHFVKEEEVALMVDRIRQETLKGSPVNLTHLLHSLSADIVSRCVLGWKPKEEKDEKRFLELSRNFAVQFKEFSVGDFFPYLKWVDAWRGFIRRLKETAEGLDALYEQTIDEHKKINHEHDDDKPHQKDFAHVLLQLQSEERPDFQLTNVKLKALLMDMIVGGIDTTSTLIEWTVSELVKNPTKMKKTQEEIRRIVGNKSKVDETDINQMKYLKCVTKETLRLHPPLPMLVPRVTASRVTLSGYEIPAKTGVLINAWAIQRDPKIWEKAEEFIPERFENNPVDYKGQHFEFIPFGVGRRGCPGLLFGIVVSEYILANLLYWFDWKLADEGEELDMAEINGVTVTKKHPLVLVPMSYSP